MMGRTLRAGALTMALGGVGVAPMDAAAQSAVPPPVTEAQTAAGTKAFLQRVDEYMKLHKTAEQQVPPLDETSDPVKIAARERALGNALIAQRREAKPGDVFVPEFRRVLDAIVDADFSTRPVDDRRALVQELPRGVKLNINMPYPTTLPLTTFPATLLQVLPELPQELEYRMVGRDLILRDVKGNVVVDIARDVFPIPR